MKTNFLFLTFPRLNNKYIGSCQEVDYNKKLTLVACSVLTLIDLNSSVSYKEPSGQEN